MKEPHPNKIVCFFINGCALYPGSLVMVAESHGKL
jgi:hypothetical protein